MSVMMEERAITALCELGLMTARLQLDAVAQLAAAERALTRIFSATCWTANLSNAIAERLS